MKNYATLAHWASKCASICTINKNRYYLFSIILLLTLGVGSMWGAEYTFGTIPSGWSANGGTMSINGKSWTYSSSTYIGLNSSKIQIGSKNNPQTSNWTIQIPISSFGSNVKVTKVAMTAYTTATTATYDISVSGASVKSGSLTTSSATYSSNTLNATTGNIVVTLKGSNNSKAMYLSNISVTYETATSTTYTINWYVNGTKEYSQTATTGTTLTNIPNLDDYECNGKVFVGWTTQSGYSNATTAPNGMITSTSGMTMPEGGEDYYAVFAEPGGTGTTSWVETDISDIKATDDVLITMTKSASIWALNSENGTSKAPAANVVTQQYLESGEDADRLLWNISKDGNNLTIYPKGSTTKWLYCTNSNDGVRVGTNENKVFTIDATSGYLKNTATSRYVGVYITNPDWRCYTSTTGNIVDQTLAFYKKTTTGGYQNYTTECSAPTEFTVTYEANGHGTAPAAQTITSGEKATEPTAPTATGYTFGGWYKESACTNKFDFSTPITDNINLYAKWTPITYTVSFNNNGGTGTMNSQTFTYDAAQNLTANSFTRTGYTFNGWNTKSDGSGDSYTNSQSVKNLASTNGATITLYAQWKIQTFTVAFDKNGGTGTMANQTFTYNQAQTLTANTFTRAGYTFNGWNTKSDGSGNSYTDKQSIILTAAGLTLYAQWTANTYTVKFDGNGSDGGSMTVQSFTYGQSQALSANAFTRADYAFKNWNTKSDGTGTNYTDKQSVSNLTVTNGATVTLYAQWTPIYTITWVANGQSHHTQTAVEGTALEMPSAPDVKIYDACEDKVFVGWTETQIVNSTNTQPADLFTSKSGTLTANKTYYAVFATAEGTPSTDYAKITNINDLADGNYVIAYSYDGGIQVVLKNTIKNTTQMNGTNLSLSSGIYANPADDYIWQLTKQADGSYYIYNSSASKYLSATTSTLQLSDNPTKYNISYDSSNSRWTIVLKDQSTYYMHGYVSGSSYDFRVSTSGSGNKYRIYLYKNTSTVTYSEYVTTCVEIPDPVLSFATTPADPIIFDPVNCGGTTTKAQAKTVQVSGANLQDVVSVGVTGPYKIARTSSTNLSDYTTSLTLDITAAGAINANYSTIYIISCPPAQSTDATTGTLTFTTKKGNTLTVNLSTPTVNCTTYALTFNDRGNKTVENYYAGVEVPQPADPTGVCTDPIHYVFDGWAEATVVNGSTEYTKVTFPYTMPGQNKTLYAVYRYLSTGGNGDYNLVTSDLDDWSGDYLIAYNNETFAYGTVGGEDGIGKLKNKVDLSSYISNNTIPATEGDKYKVTLESVTGGYVLKTQDGKYNYHTNNDKNGISATTNINTADDYPINVQFVSQEQVNLCLTGAASGSVLRYNTTGYFRFYKNGGQEPVYLYKKSSGTTLYTTSPICGAYVEITSDKDIYVTGGNARGTHDLVVAQQKVAYQATRLKKDNETGNLPSIQVRPANITYDATKTKNVTITFDEDSVRTLQSDDTYTISGTMTISYRPETNNVTDDIQVVLNANYNPSADVSNASFTIHARSLPQEFVIVAKQGDKWYALNGDMSNGSSANPANGHVVVDDDNEPTKATYAPCNTIYTFDGLPNTGDRTSVRFQGTDGAWLWAASGTNVGIQNKSLKNTPSGNMEESKPYNWEIETENNITYFFHNANSSRVLRLNDGKFGMYAGGTDVIRILPYEAKCLYNYAPSNLKVSELKSTYVTLVWDAVAGATKYQYCTDATNWTDAGTEPTVTINGLNSATNYTYYIRAYHADAGVSQECFDYSEVTFTTADCDDVPTDISYTADLNSITVSWTASAASATIKLYSDENGEHPFFTQSGATSPWKISSLTKNTTYYLQIFSNGTCASPIVPVKTEDVKVDIVEWQPQGIVVDINTNEKVGVTLENEEIGRAHV